MDEICDYSSWSTTRFSAGLTHPTFTWSLLHEHHFIPALLLIRGILALVSPGCNGSVPEVGKCSKSFTNTINPGPKERPSRSRRRQSKARLLYRPMRRGGAPTAISPAM